MFRKKRRLPKYKFKYGKTPIKKGKNYKSQGFQRIKKRSTGKIKKLGKSFTLACILAVFILLFYWIFFSNFFKVSQIKFSNDTLDNETLKEEIIIDLRTITDKNLIFINTGKIEEHILGMFPELKKIEVRKKYPRTLDLHFSQYDPVANIINQSAAIKKTYIINSIGYVVRENMENPSLPYIVIKSDEPINTETQAIEKSRLNYILESTEYFQDKFGMRVTEIEYKPIPREVHLLTERGFRIWMDIQHPYEEQLKKLKKVQVKLDIHKENLEYIDLRIAGGSGDKIIYKRR